MTHSQTSDLELLKLEIKTALEEAQQGLKKIQKQMIFWIVGSVSLGAISIITAIKFV